MREPIKAPRDADTIVVHDTHVTKRSLAYRPSAVVYRPEDDAYLPVFAGVGDARKRRQARKRERRNRRSRT